MMLNVIVLVGQLKITWLSHDSPTLVLVLYGHFPKIKREIGREREGGKEKKRGREREEEGEGETGREKRGRWGEI